MSKIEIKFWDKEKKVYFSKDVMVAFKMTIDADLNVVGPFGKIVKEIEPHFYKDGERIDGE